MICQASRVGHSAPGGVSHSDPAKAEHIPKQAFLPPGAARQSARLVGCYRHQYAVCCKGIEKSRVTTGIEGYVSSCPPDIGLQERLVCASLAAFYHAGVLDGAGQRTPNQPPSSHLPLPSRGYRSTPAERATKPQQHAIDGSSQIRAPSPSKVPSRSKITAFGSCRQKTGTPASTLRPGPAEAPRSHMQNDRSPPL